MEAPERYKCPLCFTDFTHHSIMIVHRAMHGTDHKICSFSSGTREDDFGNEYAAIELMCSCLQAGRGSSLFGMFSTARDGDVAEAQWKVLKAFAKHVTGSDMLPGLGPEDSTVAIRELMRFTELKRFTNPDQRDMIRR